MPGRCNNQNTYVTDLNHARANFQHIQTLNFNFNQTLQVLKFVLKFLTFLKLFLFL